MAKSFKLAAKFFSDLSTLFEDGAQGAPAKAASAPPKGRYLFHKFEFINK